MVTAPKQVDEFPFSTALSVVCELRDLYSTCQHYLNAILIPSSSLAQLEKQERALRAYAKAPDSGKHAVSLGLLPI